jgi:hypothetical protein
VVEGAPCTLAQSGLRRQQHEPSHSPHPLNRQTSNEPFRELMAQPGPFSDLARRQMLDAG